MLDAILPYIHIPFLAIGLMGGFVHVFRVKKATPWQIIGYVLTGGLAANFFVPLLLKIIIQAPMVLRDVDLGGLLSFGVGMSGRKICFYAEKWFGSLTPFGKIKNE